MLHSSPRKHVVTPRCRCDKQEILRNSLPSFTELRNPSSGSDHDEPDEEKEEERVDADMGPVLPTNQRPELKVPTEGMAATHEGSGDNKSRTRTKRRSGRGKARKREKKGVLTRSGWSRRHRRRESWESQVSEPGSTHGTKYSGWKWC